MANQRTMSGQFILSGRIFSSIFGVNKSVIITETTFVIIFKPHDIAELPFSLSCWVENHSICMIMSCVGFEVQVHKFLVPYS